MKKLLVIGNDNTIYLKDTHVETRRSISLHVRHQGLEKFYVDEIICCHWYNNSSYLMMKGELNAEVSEDIALIFGMINSKDFYMMGSFYFVNTENLVEIRCISRKGCIIMDENLSIYACKQLVRCLKKNIEAANNGFVLKLKNC